MCLVLISKKAFLSLKLLHFLSNWCSLTLIFSSRNSKRLQMWISWHSWFRIDVDLTKYTTKKSYSLISWWKIYALIWSFPSQFKNSQTSNVKINIVYHNLFLTIVVGRENGLFLRIWCHFSFKKIGREFLSLRQKFKK